LRDTAFVMSKHQHSEYIKVIRANAISARDVFPLPTYIGYNIVVLYIKVISIHILWYLRQKTNAHVDTQKMTRKIKTK